MGRLPGVGPESPPRRCFCPKLQSHHQLKIDSQDSVVDGHSSKPLPDLTGWNLPRSVCVAPPLSVCRSTNGSPPTRSGDVLSFLCLSSDRLIFSLFQPSLVFNYAIPFTSKNCIRNNLLQAFDCIGSIHLSQPFWCFLFPCPSENCFSCKLSSGHKITRPVILVNVVFCLH